MEFQLPANNSSIIKVIGIGGGGGNAVNNMYKKGISGVDFVICNTDKQSLDMSPVPLKIRLGAAQTEGLGAGANPEVGRLAAQESLDEIRNILKDNARMVFITAGMGGGTGTGASPVIAALAKEMGILTVGIVTMPFTFEGKKRRMQAEEGIRLLEQSVDTMLVISNDNLTHIFGANVTMKRAFEEADSVLCDAAKGIAEIITLEGYINVDFADVQTIMKDGGTALMGTAAYSGDDRALQAVQEAISSPLLDNVSIHGSRGILVNITASESSLRLDETTTIIQYIQQAAGDDADIIFGTVYDEAMGDKISVTVIATGFDKTKRTFAEAETAEEDSRTLTISLETEQYGISDIRFTEKEIIEPEREPKKQKENSVPLSSRDQSLEDRIRKLKNEEYNYHNPDKLKQLEDEPAWKRNQVEIAEELEKKPEKLSRVSLDEIPGNRFELNDNNSFLHDNVD